MTIMSLWTVRFLFIIVSFKLLITVNIFHTAKKMNIEKKNICGYFGPVNSAAKKKYKVKFFLTQ